ncbi:unnamed protein product [Choristocarpus tenellus]
MDWGFKLVTSMQILSLVRASTWKSKAAFQSTLLNPKSAAIFRSRISAGLWTSPSRGGLRAFDTLSMSARMPSEGYEVAKGLCADVIPVPVLNDNYAYLLVDRESRMAACIDPAEPEKVIKAAKDHNVTISALLCTHKHWDHSGGNEAMKKMIPNLEVVSSAYEDDVPAMTLALKDQECFTLGSLSVKALHTPCHTRGHIIFFVSDTKMGCKDGGAPVLFSGDTLFIGGCGRFFEGDASQMAHALQDVVGSLPGETRVFCGHEYTVSNLQFAASVEPENADVAKKLAWSREILRTGGFTVPSTLDEELLHNPFMRITVPSVQVATGAKDGVEVMARLRTMKNDFRPPPETASRFPKL